jgi:uncharacterized protein (DUF2267 family)
MEHQDFLTTVQQAAGVDRQTAERATIATLQTLAERISREEARDLADRLPPELAGWLAAETRGQPFGVDEFLRRVAEREGVDPRTAEQHAGAVFLALGRALGRDELDDVLAQLPQEYGPLLRWAPGPHPHIVTLEELLEHVRRHGGLDEASARRATEAVLETLGERISRGEVEDLLAQLPVELHAPLRRGDDLSHGAARPMSLDDFVRRVAEREGVTPDTAREHARAVFAALRAAISSDEFFDVSAQLPDDYAALLAHP